MQNIVFFQINIQVTQGNIIINRNYTSNDIIINRNYTNTINIRNDTNNYTINIRNYPNNNTINSRNVHKFPNGAFRPIIIPLSAFRQLWKSFIVIRGYFLFQFTFPSKSHPIKNCGSTMIDYFYIIFAEISLI